jgi:hypothetical protein
VLQPARSQQFVIIVVAINLIFSGILIVFTISDHAGAESFIPFGATSEMNPIPLSPINNSYLSNNTPKFEWKIDSNKTKNQTAFLV